MSDPKGAKGPQGKPTPSTPTEENTEKQSGDRLSLKTDAADGLLLVGIVSGRRRRPMVTQGKPTRFAITLTVHSTCGDHRVDLFSDTPHPDCLPKIGAVVSLPIDVRVFQTKSGPRFGLTVAQGEQGEAF